MEIPAWLSPHLACPRCQDGPSARHRAAALCGLRLALPQPTATSVDLRGDWTPDPRWLARQHYMEHEYDALLDDGDHAARAFQNDYRTIGALLDECKGRIVDVGGGIGVTREWLGSAEHYVLVEPGDIWRDSRWLAWADCFPCIAQPVVHIRAYAEALPFAAGTFDVVLHLWTLNHVADVRLSVQEGLRVLRRGGRLVAVLEEAPTTWRDVIAAQAGAYGLQRARAALRALAAMTWRPPMQADHVAVDERILTRDASCARAVS